MHELALESMTIIVNQGFRNHSVLVT